MRQLIFNISYYFTFSFFEKIHNITPATTVKHLSTFDIKKADAFFPTSPTPTQNRQNPQHRRCGDRKDRGGNSEI